jgi:hypothetical protein
LVKNFPKLNTPDPLLNRIQDSIAILFAYIQGSPLVGNVSMVKVALTTSPATVDHKLGRVPQGFIVVDIDAAATPYRVTPFSLLSVQMQADAPCQTKLLFF